jgi:hypothetical protein
MISLSASYAAQNRRESPAGDMQAGAKHYLNSTGSRRIPTKNLQGAEITDIARECLRHNADYRRDFAAMIANSPDGEVTPEFRRRWASAFAHDPQTSFDEQTIFWAP